MAKQLSEMTLEELWQLFPIFLTEHQECWGDWFLEEKQSLQRLLSFPVRIHHIGSTAVQGIWAKPIIDILMEAETVEQLNEITQTLKENGYLLMNGKPTRVSLNKGYTEQGFAERVFHIHIRLQGDIDEVYFRDYLQANPEFAKAYERLKLDLWKRYEHDRDGYTEAKTEFIKTYTMLAKAEKK